MVVRKAVKRQLKRVEGAVRMLHKLIMTAPETKAKPKKKRKAKKKKAKKKRR